MIVRFKCKNEEDENRFGMDEECRFREAARETVEHLLKGSTKLKESDETKRKF